MTLSSNHREQQSHNIPPHEGTHAAQNFYEASYKDHGLDAQRRYPNEEFCRFMGRNFFSFPEDQRRNMKILETGCGSGANLWMIAKKGFQAYGVDLSSEGISLAKSMLDRYGVTANLSVQDMSQLDFPESTFDAIVDIFSSYCLTKEQHKLYLRGVVKLLKPGGLFFSYFPSKQSDAYLFPGEAGFIDPDTLDSISRKDSPFFGQNYPFRFIHPREYENQLLAVDLTTQYSEMLHKTYRNQQENFSFVVIEARKPDVS